MAKAFVDGLFDDGEYRRQKEQIEFDLASLVVLEANATEEAGRLLLDLPRLWAKATMDERRRLLLTVLDAVYVDAKGSRSVVEVRVKAAFRVGWISSEEDYGKPDLTVTMTPTAGLRMLRFA